MTENDRPDFTIEVRDRTGAVIFAGAVDVTRPDEFLTITGNAGEPARVSCIASDLSAAVQR